MRVITKRRLTEFGRAYADARGPLEEWLELVEEAEWQNLAETRRVFPHADEIMAGKGKPVTVFNIKGKKYRLITAIHYDKQRVFVMRFLTHAKYSKDKWKETL